MIRAFSILGVLAFAAAPISARESLGIFENWGAFRDPETPRCYAIAMPSEPARRPEQQAYASVGTWPGKQVRNQFHIRLSRKPVASARIRLAIGRARFELAGGGGDGWAMDRQADAAIVAAIRSGTVMTVSARDSAGRYFADEYALSGAATAMDAATLGCARR